MGESDHAFLRACSTAKRQYFITRNQVIAQMRAPGLWKRGGLSLLQLALFVAPAMAYLKSAARSHAFMYIAAALTFYGLRAWYSLSPKHMQVVPRGYTDRKLRFHRLVLQAQHHSRLSAAEVVRYREDALELIASYVRDHRADTSGTTIYANLLVADGNDMLVLARNRDHRQPGSRTPKDDSLAWRCFFTGEDQFTGDVYRDYPTTPSGKKYKSIMTMPVKNSGVVLGVVSVDSSKPYHFDSDFQDLVIYLGPYVALLAWTLEAGRIRQATGVSVAVGTE